MTDKPVELDEHRGMAAQKSTEARRCLREVKADQSALRDRQEEFERCAVTAPSASWPAVAQERDILSSFLLPHLRLRIRVAKS
jgi:hypothetical protein